MRTAPLSNVAMTPPYMHNSSQGQLSDVIGLYENRNDLGVTLEDDDVGDEKIFSVNTHLSAVNTVS